MGDVQELCACIATKNLPTKTHPIVIMSKLCIATRNTTIWSMRQYKDIRGNDQEDILFVRTMMIRKVTLNAMRIKIEISQVEQGV